MCFLDHILDELEEPILVELEFVEHHLVILDNLLLKLSLDVPLEFSHSTSLLFYLSLLATGHNVLDVHEWLHPLFLLFRGLFLEDPFALDVLLVYQHVCVLASCASCVPPVVELLSAPKGFICHFVDGEGGHS